jgi:3-isopropylmalate dehydrogenase
MRNAFILGPLMKIAVLPGDGIGLEIVPQAVKVLKALERPGLAFEFSEAPVGGTAIDLAGKPLPDETLAVVNSAAAVLFGAVGDPKFDALPQGEKPGFALRKLRKEFGLFSNLRPVRLLPALASASTLKPEVVAGLDLLIVRELNGDIYYGTPRGIDMRDGERVGTNTMQYTESQIARIAHVAFAAARGRRGKVCSIDKSNVLETMGLWREVVTEVGKDYPDVALTHMLVDSAAMQLVRNPLQFDVMLTPNLFGDILSDQASMLTGSIGLLPSASLGEGGFGLYEPIHGSAPDLAGRNLANPIATILSAAMLLRHSFDLITEAERIEAAVLLALNEGLRTADIAGPGETVTGTAEAGDRIVAALR